MSKTSDTIDSIREAGEELADLWERVRDPEPGPTPTVPSVELEEPTDRTPYYGAAAGAGLGFLVFGPLGALAGGALGYLAGPKVLR